MTASVQAGKSAPRSVSRAKSGRQVFFRAAHDISTREISQNAQLAAQGNGTLVVNIGSLSDAMGNL